MKPTYESPLASRYASKTMLHLFSPDMRYETWRRLWVALARAEHTLGLPVTQQQVDALAAHVSPLDYDAVAKREKEVRHDVMAHIRTFGDACPKAAGIIHLGATSCNVDDNTDLLQMRAALKLIRGELLAVIDALSEFAAREADTPTLAWTHFQAAQPTTVGKRATLWLQDFLLDLEQLETELSRLPISGCKGATGTAASFLALFHGDGEKVLTLEKKIAEKMGVPNCIPVAGQTYTRKLDSFVMNVLSGIAQSAAKMATDMRLLAHLRELDEPFETEQVGSSAMAYKRNPMRCERVCSLSRYVVNLASNTADTAMTQWLERTLDDSANRRISLPEGFLAVDGILRLMQNVTAGLRVNEKIVAKFVADYLPFIATENLLMAAVERGGDRQQVHEIIRRASMRATEAMKNGEPWELIAELAAEPTFGLTEAEIRAALRRPVGARSLHGVTRRTQAGMGRCQGGFCGSKVVEILARELGQELDEITKCGGESKILFGRTK